MKRLMILAGWAYSLAVVVWLVQVPSSASIRPDGTVFEPGEVEIVVNRRTMEAWIFHTPAFPFVASHAEYDHVSSYFYFVSEDGERFDLGVRIRSLVRPVIEGAEAVVVTQVHDGFLFRSFSVPIRHLNAENQT